MSEPTKVYRPIPNRGTKLENCEACGEAISRSALKCPHCGHPAGEARRRAENLNIAVVAAIIVAVIAVIGALLALPSMTYHPH